jgi:predicted amidophosphoribosyltransferase
MFFWENSCDCCGNYAQHTIKLRHKEETVSPNICQKCSLEFWDLRLPQTKINHEAKDVHGIYRYDSTIKDLIWRAKIQDDQKALSLLLFLGIQPWAISHASWADIIIPAPSSLWGRLRGRLDIAALFAYNLGRQVKRPVMQAPYSLFWRLQKSAKKSAHARKRSKKSSLFRRIRNYYNALWRIHLHKNMPHARRILIVDDIVTTGSTFHEFRKTIRDSGSKKLPQLSIKMLSLAVACSVDEVRRSNPLSGL